jgi:TRAP-type C4-dicarboxylate transport system substrate-binding protein
MKVVSTQKCEYPFFSVMNKDTYDSLSDSEKKVLEKVSGIEMSAKSGRVFDVDAEKGVELSKEKGAEFIELTGDKLKPWQDALQPIVEEWIAEMEKEGFDAQKIYDRAMELKEEVRE